MQSRPGTPQVLIGPCADREAAEQVALEAAGRRNPLRVQRSFGLLAVSLFARLAH